MKKNNNLEISLMKDIDKSCNKPTFHNNENVMRHNGVCCITLQIHCKCILSVFHKRKQSWYINFEG